MKQKAYIRPGRSASIVGIITASAMLLFGMFFFSLLNSEGGEGNGVGLVFMIFWMLIVLCIIAYNIYNLTFRNASSAAMEEIEFDSKEGADAAENDFNTKLRKLEELKKDGLITSDEYAAKRAEIMQQKW
jgi:amino acid permease